MHSRRIRISFVFALAVAAVATVRPTAAAQPEPSSDVRQIEPVTEGNVEARPLGLPDATTPVTAAEQQVLGSGEHGSKIGISRTLAALAGVVGLVVLLFLAFKQFALKRGGLAAALGAGGRAPSGVIEVLARYPLARTQRLVLLRIGRRVVLCSQSCGVRGSHGGMTTLTDITDPEEVASILRAVRDSDGTSSNAIFKAALKQAERDPAMNDDFSLQYRTTDGDMVQWQDPRIHIPQREPSEREVDPAIGRLRARLASMRSRGDAA